MLHQEEKKKSPTLILHYQIPYFFGDNTLYDIYCSPIVIFPFLKYTEPFILQVLELAVLLGIFFLHTFTWSHSSVYLILCSNVSSVCLILWLPSHITISLFYCFQEITIFNYVVSLSISILEKLYDVKDNRFLHFCVLTDYDYI